MGESPYARRVRGALAEYRSIAGHAPDPHVFDPERPGVKQAYRAFVRRPVELGLGAAHGDWLALKSGLKPLMRELVEPQRWPVREAQLVAEGFRYGVHPMPVRSGPRDGYLADERQLRVLEQRRDLGVQEEVDAPLEEAARSGQDRLLVLIGRDPAAVEEALSIERRLLGGFGQEQAVRLSARLGRLLGYPDCCVDAFAELGTLRSNVRAIRAAAGRSDRFEPLLNNLNLNVFHHISWFPCRYDCPTSLERGLRLDALLQGGQAERRVQAMPLLYLDDRRQVVFDGRADATGVRFASVHTPFAFDRRADCAALEWVFWMDRVEPLRAGDRLDVGPEELTLRRGVEILSRLPRPEGSVWLPFGAAA